MEKVSPAASAVWGMTPCLRQAELILTLILSIWLRRGAPADAVGDSESPASPASGADYFTLGFSDVTMALDVYAQLCNSRCWRH